MLQLLQAFLRKIKFPTALRPLRRGKRRFLWKAMLTIFINHKSAVHYEFLLEGKARVYGTKHPGISHPVVQKLPSSLGLIPSRRFLSIQLRQKTIMGKVFRYSRGGNEKSKVALTDILNTNYQKCFVDW